MKIIVMGIGAEDGAPEALLTWIAKDVPPVRIKDELGLLGDFAYIGYFVWCGDHVPIYGHRLLGRMNRNHVAEYAEQIVRRYDQGTSRRWRRANGFDGTAASADSA